MRMVILTNVIFLMKYIEMCQNLEDLYNSVNQYFPNGQWKALQKSHSMQDGPMDFIVKVQRVHWLCVQILYCNKPTFKKLPLVKFGGV